MWITLNRPDAINSLNDAVADSLAAGLDAAAADNALRCIIIRAEGRVFCVGADLKVVQEKSAEGTMDRFGNRLSDVFNRIETFPKPVIAAVNGLALAGGLELILCYDSVIAAESAKIGDAHANYGLIPGGGGSVRLPRKIEPTRAKYLMYTGDFLEATALERMGLFNQVVPDASLEKTVAMLAAHLGEKSPLGLKLMKQLINNSLEQPKETALCNELMAIATHSQSQDWIEGLAAFAEKRKPKFTGR